MNLDFCAFLEYEIGKALKHSNDPRLKGFWCDGVLLPDTEDAFSKKVVNDTRQVEMKAYVGPNGQDAYQLILCFGAKALSRYARGLSLEECVPEDNWLEVDIEKKIIVTQLN